MRDIARFSRPAHTSGDARLLIDSEFDSELDSKLRRCQKAVALEPSLRQRLS
jgi:hypothetical protein